MTGRAGHSGSYLVITTAVLRAGKRCLWPTSTDRRGLWPTYPKRGYYGQQLMVPVRRMRVIVGGPPTLSSTRVGILPGRACSPAAPAPRPRLLPGRASQIPPHRPCNALYREVRCFQWQRTACPLPSHLSARAVGGEEDKGPRLACILLVMTFHHDGQTRAVPSGRNDHD
jgi:hypothetical protein